MMMDNKANVASSALSKRRFLKLKIFPTNEGLWQQKYWINLQEHIVINLPYRVLYDSGTKKFFIGFDT